MEFPAVSELPGSKTTLAATSVPPRRSSAVPPPMIPHVCLAIGIATFLESATILAASEDPADSRVAPFIGGESMAERELRSILARERNIWTRLDERKDDENANLRAESEFRTIISAYQNLLTSSPDFAEGYAAYGRLLNRVGARSEAIRALLKANQIDPNIPVVKNQIANHLTEDGEYRAALPYYLAAIELDSDVPLYHYQLGSLLYEFRRFFIDDGLYNDATLDGEMQSAFQRAAQLSPGTWAYAYRYAESFYDLATPDWPTALIVWGELNARAKPGVERQTIQLHLARVLTEMGRQTEARALLTGIDAPVLAASKSSLEERLVQPVTRDAE